MRTVASLPLWRVFVTVLALVTIPLVRGRAIEVEPVETRSDLEERALYPDNDPWYRPPTGFESAEPGAILRKRRIITAFLGVIPSPVETWQLLYRTTAIDGTPITTATTIFRPLFAKSDRFISFHTAYDSTNTKCSPSYTYQLGAVPEELITQAERLVVTLYLLSGYIVASPDYEGPDAAYGVGRIQATAALDGMRAVRNFSKELRLSTSNPSIVGMGYSGGAIATGWAAQLHPKYAPELNIKGWLSGGTPVNLSSTFDNIDGKFFSGFAPSVINGLCKPSAYEKQIKPLVDSVMLPAGRKVLETADSVCTVGALLAFTEHSILEPKYQTLGPDLLRHPTVAEVLTELTMGLKDDETPTAPILLYHSEVDQVIPFAPAEELAKNWCAKGVNVHWIAFGAGGHGGTEALGLIDSLKFTADAFDGKLAKGCPRKTVLDEVLNPIGLAFNLEPIAVKIVDLFAQIIKDSLNNEPMIKD